MNMRTWLVRSFVRLHCDKEAHSIFGAADVVVVVVGFFPLAYDGIEFCCDITNDGEYCQCFIRRRVFLLCASTKFYGRTEMIHSFFV